MHDNIKVESDIHRMNPDPVREKTSCSFEFFFLFILLFLPKQEKYLKFNI